MKSTKRQLARNSFHETRRLPSSELKRMSNAELLQTINGYRKNNDDFRVKIQELILENAFLSRKLVMYKRRLRAVEVKRGGLRTFNQGYKQIINNKKRRESVVN